MTDNERKPTHQERLRGILHPDGKPPLPGKKEEAEEEISCGAFGYLRGIRDLPGSVVIPLPRWQQRVVSLRLARPVEVTLTRAGCCSKFSGQHGVPGR